MFLSSNAKTPRFIGSAPVLCEYCGNFLLERNIVRIFANNDNGYDEKGNKIQVTRGDETKGEPVRLPFSPARKQEQLETIADAALARLKGNRNKGSITTLLYPFVSLWDFIEYEDTLFPELSSNYYVIGTELNCDDSGYHNVLSVTDEMFYYEKA